MRNRFDANYNIIKFISEKTFNDNMTYYVIQHTYQENL